VAPGKEKKIESDIPFEDVARTAVEKASFTESELADTCGISLALSLFSKTHTQRRSAPMEMETLKDLYVEELKDLYSAEKQIIKGLNRMSKAANHPELKQAFTRHAQMTEKHVERLERICADLDVSPRGKKCVGMEGLIEEASELIKEKPEPDVLDAGLIAAAQHVEHYEMAGYGCVRTYARQLGFEDQAELLQTTLDEEGDTDKLLTQIAETSINIEAERAD
jgi:ferritin-like metal-binding protein YciE